MGAPNQVENNGKGRMRVWLYNMHVYLFDLSSFLCFWVSPWVPVDVDSGSEFTRLTLSDASLEPLEVFQKPSASAYSWGVICANV